MTKDARPAPSKLPWLTRLPKLDQAVNRLALALHETKTAKRTRIILTDDEETRLAQEFKAAEQGRTSADKFALALASLIKSQDPAYAYVRAKMKEWKRAAEKKLTDRTLHDLGRGRIYFQNVEEYFAFLKVFKSKDKEGHVRDLGIQNVRIIEASWDDYLAEANAHGYAGSVNFDLEIDIGKGRTGTFEIQMMPRAYTETDKHSHCLFDLIRILKELPKAYIASEDENILNALITANKALYIEHGIRSGFIKARKRPPDLKLTEEELRKTYEILDRIRTAVENLPGKKKHAWKTDTATAITYAKTSLSNLFFAGQLKRRPRLAADHN